MFETILCLDFQFSIHRSNCSVVKFLTGISCGIRSLLKSSVKLSYVISERRLRFIEFDHVGGDSEIVINLFENVPTRNRVLS